MNENLQINNVSKKFMAPKIVFIILGVVLAVELIFAVRTLTQPISNSLSTRPSQILPAQVSLTSAKTGYKLGDNISVSIVINTGGHKTSASDVILHFDPNILEASSTAIIKGMIYPTYANLEVNQKTGLVTVSGLSMDDKSNFSGEGVLAVVGFKAKTTGSTKLLLDFSPNATNDTNIVDSASGRDVLAKVSNLTLTVK